MSLRRGAGILVGLISMVGIGVAVPGVSYAATGWGAPVVLGSVNGQSSPQLIAAGRSGGPAVVAWTDSGVLRASVRSTGGGWSNAGILSPSGDYVNSAAAVVRPDGSIVVAWAAQRASDAVIESVVRSPAGSWSTASLVSGSGLLAAWPVALGTDGAGTILAAWGQMNPSRLRSITLATLPVGGGWSAPAQLATPVQTSLRQVVIAENAAGAAVVGWVRVAGDLYGDVTTRSAGGMFGPAVTIAQGGLRPLQNQIHYFRVGIDASGRAVSTWNTVAAYVSAQKPDGSWLPATYFSPYTRVGDLTSATDATGNTTSLWNDFGQIRTSSIAPGGGWTPQQAVLNGSNPMDLGLTANGTTLYGGWYDSNATAVTAATHTAAGWSTPVAITRLGSSGWFAGLATAPSLSGALVAWISGTTSTGQVSVSIGS